MGARRGRRPDPPRHEGPITAAALIRVSLDRSKHFGHQEELVSPQTQRDRCRHFCLARGWHLPDDYVVEEIDVSGRLVPLAERTGLQRILALARAGQIQRVVVFMFSRLSRRLADTLAVVEELNRYGCHLVSVQEPVDTAGEVGRMFLAILQAINQYQAELTARQVSETWATMARQGRRPPGKAPYGFSLVRGLPVPRPDEYPHLIRVHEILAESGSMAAALAYLQGSGARPRHGRWNRNTVAGWIRNPFYDGFVVLGGERYPAGWDPPPVPPALRERARAALAGSGPRRAGSPSGYLLAGLVHCGRCGGVYSKYSARDDALSCRRGCCNSHVSGSGLLEAVAAALRALLGVPEVQAELARAVLAELEAAAGGGSTAGIERARARIQAALDRLCDDYYKEGLLTPAEFQAAHARYAAEAAELAARLAGARRSQEELRRQAAALAARAAAGEVGPALQREFLQALGARVVVCPDAARLTLFGTCSVRLPAQRIWQRLYFGREVQRLDFPGPQGRWTARQERFLLRTCGRWPLARIAGRLGKSDRAVREKLAELQRGAGRP